MRQRVLAYRLNGWSLALASKEGNFRQPSLPACSPFSIVIIVSSPWEG